ncbi:30S ribosomal protein S3 [Sesbania bispinosa]|nr:30S ribosomal protein S3 [Sesbania bispinosa]
MDVLDKGESNYYAGGAESRDGHDTEEINKGTIDVELLRGKSHANVDYVAAECVDKESEVGVSALVCNGVTNYETGPDEEGPNEDVNTNQCGPNSVDMHRCPIISGDMQVKVCGKEKEIEEENLCDVPVLLVEDISELVQAGGSHNLRVMTKRGRPRNMFGALKG